MKSLKSMRTVMITLVLLAFGSGISAKDESFPYISPGVQLGYGFGEGAFMGAQITLGVLDESINLIAGVSVGTRKYFSAQKSLIRYYDLQVSPGLIGFGIGRSATKTPNSDGWIHGGKRFKVWGGALGLLTYDYSSNTSGERNHHWGLMGVLPLSAYSPF